MRVLVTGLSTYWGGRVAQALEQRPDVEVIVGLDTRDPRVPLERTEFVRADSSYSILSRIVRATEIDTVVHSHLIVDSTRAQRSHPARDQRDRHHEPPRGRRVAREPGTEGRREGIGAGVRRQLPGPERVPRRHAAHRAPRTAVERSLLEVEAFLRDFSEDNPHVVVTLLRAANVLGNDLDTPFAHALRRRISPEIFGFDPRVQFVHDDDVVGGLMYATTHDVPGVFNVAGDGNLPWSEVCAILGRRRVALPPVLTAWAAEPMRLHRHVGPPARGVDVVALRPHDRQPAVQARRLQVRYTSAGTVEAFAQGLRLSGAVGDTNPTYSYQRDVENFFRHSSAVVRPEQG